MLKLWQEHPIPNPQEDAAMAAFMNRLLDRDAPIRTPAEDMTRLAMDHNLTDSKAAAYDFLARNQVQDIREDLALDALLFEVGGQS